MTQKAYIVNPTIRMDSQGRKFAIGNIYNDATERFMDGVLVRTSEIQAITDEVFITRNTTYTIVGKPIYFGVQ